MTILEVLLLSLAWAFPVYRSICRAGEWLIRWRLRKFETSQGRMTFNRPLGSYRMIETHSYPLDLEHSAQ